MVILYFQSTYSTRFQIVIPIFQYVLVHDSFRDFILSFETFEVSKFKYIYVSNRLLMLLKIWFFRMYFCSIYDLFSCVHNHHYLVFVLSDLGIPGDNQSDIVQDTVGTCRPAAERRKTQLAKTADCDKQLSV